MRSLVLLAGEPADLRRAPDKASERATGVDSEQSTLGKRHEPFVETTPNGVEIMWDIADVGG